MYAVIFTYSFDPDAQVFLFRSEEKAKNFLKESFEQEYRVELDENEWEVDAEHNDDWTHASVTHFGDFGEDVCEYHLSCDVRNVK